MTVREWAELYLSKGWQVVPLAPGTKECRDAAWTKLKFKAEDFEPDDNLGLRSVDGIVVIDEDCPEAVACADLFLPPTRAIYGRKSKPRSKRLYRSKFDKTVPFKDLEEGGGMLLEIRSQHQDMAPPSRHPDGELLEWATHEVADEVASDKLLRAARLNATCALVSRYYNPPGSRHDWCMALSGTLRQLGITEEECNLILRGSSTWANDFKLADRLVEVRSTYTKPDDDPIKGARSLMELMERGKSFLKSLNKIWGSSSSAFLLDAKGEKILSKNPENIRRALEKLGVTLSFDLFAQKAIIRWNKFHAALNDAICRDLWFEVERVYHFQPPKDYFWDTVEHLAYKNKFHPVVDYLESVKWDGVNRLEDWLIRAGKAADQPFTRAVSAIVLMAAVRRVIHPGCKYDEMLVLESGEQGLQKSSALQLLCPTPAWFSDDLPLNVESKQIVERTIGKWIIEASDLSGMSPTKAEHLKAMLSRQVDGPVRLAYGRLPVEQPRQFIIIGTTNSYSYLTDLTGNRRFWPVRVERFDLGWIRENRDQLWAEAYSRVRNGGSIRLPQELWEQAELQQTRRLTGDPWENALTKAFCEEHMRVSPDEPWEVLGVTMERRDAKGQLRIATIMQKLGFRRMTVVDPKTKHRVKGWGKGDRNTLIDLSKKTDFSDSEPGDM